MGEQILQAEGFEVVTVTDGDTAAVRLADVDPDVVLADAGLPSRNGYDLCQYIKANPRYSYMRVIVTAAAGAELDEAQALRFGSDGTLRKPFDASSLLNLVRPLAELVRKERAVRDPVAAPAADPARVRAAVTLALDAAMPALIQEVTARVLEALKD
jgi:DNA-binding response OmpR family regulator